MKLQIGDLVTFGPHELPAWMNTDGSRRQFVVMGFEPDGRVIVRDVSIEATVTADITKVLAETKP